MLIHEATEKHQVRCLTLWFYDDDGGGRFETRLGASQLQKIPEWVTQAGR
jgi:hypothetical protein